MRPLIAIAISISILLGVRAYLQFAASLRGQHGNAVEEVAASGIYSAEITLTFDAEADSFSLEPTALVLKKQDKVLLAREGQVAAGEPLVVDKIAGVVEGKNAFFFECVPKNDGQAIARAVRVRILRDGLPVAEQTLWAEPGQVPRGEIVLDVTPARKVKDEHAH